jgi:hypothetical protein
MHAVGAGLRPLPGTDRYQMAGVWYYPVPTVKKRGDDEEVCAERVPE